jgi:hypothetical protein
MIAAAGLPSPSFLSDSVGMSAGLAAGVEVYPLHPTLIGFYSTPADVLQILSEMSWDTLFLLVGLGFVAVAVLGNISGKISPGKGGRIAAGFVGASLIACGFWYHSTIHGFRVTLVDVAPPQSQVGSCPLEVNLQGIVDSSGSGDVIYYFEFSNGNASASQTANFQKTDSQIVPGIWEVHESLNNAWVRLDVVAPAKQASKRSRPFSVTCLTGSPAGGEQPSTSAITPPTHAVAPQPRIGSSSPAPASATAPTGPVAADSTDSVALDSAVPAPGTYLKRGQPLTFNINVSYNLASANSALLSVSTVQLRASPAGCKGGTGELTNAVDLPIVRGRHQAQVRLTWSGDTGSATKGSNYGSGYVSFSPMIWANSNGARGARLDFFGTDSKYCYQFGP